MGTSGNSSSRKLTWLLFLIVLLLGVGQLILGFAYNTSASPPALIVFTAVMTVVTVASGLFQGFSGGVQSFFDALRIPGLGKFLRARALFLILCVILFVSFSFDAYLVLARPTEGVTGTGTRVPPIITPSSTPTAAASPFSTPNGIPSLPLPVQSAFMASTNDTSTVSFTQEVRPGDLILVAVTQYERQVTDLRDSQGDAWKKVGGTFADSVDQQDFIELYLFPNVKGKEKTAVTVSFGSFTDSGGGDTNVGIYEYADLMVKDGETTTSNGQKVTGIALDRVLLTSNHGLCFAVGVDSGPDNNGAPYDHTVKKGDQYTLLYPSTTEELALDDANARERFYTEAAPVPAGGCLPNFSIAPSYTAYLAIVAVSLAPSS